MKLRLVSDRKELTLGRPLLNLYSIFHLGLLLTLRVIESRASPPPDDIRNAMVNSKPLFTPALPKYRDHNSDRNTYKHTR